MVDVQWPLIDELPPKPPDRGEPGDRGEHQRRPDVEQVGAQLEAEERMANERQAMIQRVGLVGSANPARLLTGKYAPATGSTGVSIPPVAPIHPPPAYCAVLRTAHGVHLGSHQRSDELFHHLPQQIRRRLLQMLA
jgi:hypothetical protein